MITRQSQRAAAPSAKKRANSDAPSASTKKPRKSKAKKNQPVADKTAEGGGDGAEGGGIDAGANGEEQVEGSPPAQSQQVTTASKKPPIPETYRCQCLYKVDKRVLATSFTYEITADATQAKRQWQGVRKWFADIEYPGFAMEPLVNVTAMAERQTKGIYRATLDVSSPGQPTDCWRELAKELVAMKELRRRLIVEVTAETKRITAPADPKTPRPAGESQAPAASQRQTATERQRKRMAQTVDEMESDGDYRSRLTKRWQCMLPACRNNSKKSTVEGQGLCWVNGPLNTPSHHYPLYSQALLMWADAIREEKATAEVPPADIAVRLTQKKLHGRTRDGDLVPGIGATRRGQQSQMPFVIHQHFGGAALPAGTFTDAAGSPYGRLPVSRSPSPPMSSQQPPEDHWTDFFYDTRNKNHWSRDWLALDRMEAEIKDAGYTVEQILSMDVAAWLGHGFKIGHKERIKDALKLWKSNRRRERDERQREHNEREARYEAEREQRRRRRDLARADDDEDDGEGGNGSEDGEDGNGGDGGDSPLFMREETMSADDDDLPAF